MQMRCETTLACAIKRAGLIVHVIGSLDRATGAISPQTQTPRLRIVRCRFAVRKSFTVSWGAPLLLRTLKDSHYATHNLLHSGGRSRGILQRQTARVAREQHVEAVCKAHGPHGQVRQRWRCGAGGDGPLAIRVASSSAASCNV